MPLCWNEVFTGPNPASFEWTALYYSAMGESEGAAGRERTFVHVWGSSRSKGQRSLRWFRQEINARMTRFLGTRLIGALFYTSRLECLW